MQEFNNIITTCFLVLIISLLPINDKNSHFNISLLAQGFLNKLIIICIVFLLLIEDYNLGLLVLILSFSIFFLDPKNITEGFISYYRKN